MRYGFDWDPNKERINIQKHGVSFRQAATVFKDPNQFALFDKKHSDTEERWITIGIDNTGILRVVVHTFRKINETLWQIRIISARKANNEEIRQYNEMTT